MLAPKILCHALLCLLCFSLTFQAPSGNTNGGLTISLLGRQRFSLSPEFQSFTPTTPSPENVNCYFDVPSTVTVGGECLQFRQTGRWACTSGVYVQFTRDCEPQRRATTRRARANNRRNSP